jgi:hypothetical protein
MENQKGNIDFIDKLYSEQFSDYEYSEAKPDWNNLDMRMNSSGGFRFNLRSFRFLYPFVLLGGLILPAYMAKYKLDANELKAMPAVINEKIVTVQETNISDTSGRTEIFTNEFRKKKEYLPATTSAMASQTPNDSTGLSMEATSDTTSYTNINVPAASSGDSIISASKKALNKTYIETPVIIDKTIVKEKNTKLGRRKK